MTPTLYISDLDGTLLGPSGRLPAQTHAALAEMLEDGLPFTVASARSVASIKTLLEGLPLSLPVIEFNGAFISDLATGRHEVVNALAPDAVEGVYGLMGEFGCVPVISTFDGAGDCVYFSQGSNAGMQMGNAGAQWWRDDCLARCDTRWRAASDLRRAFADQVVCLTIIDKQETLAPLEAALLMQWGPP